MLTLDVTGAFAVSAASEKCVRVDGLVYARHGHELMGWKSPVGVPVMSTMWTTITTS